MQKTRLALRTKHGARKTSDRGKPAKKSQKRNRPLAKRKLNLDHYRSMIVALRDETVHEIDSLNESLMPEVVAQGEQPEEITGSMQTVLMIDRQRKLLNALESALLRIEKGSYGACSSCGGFIEAERLEAVPYTRLCVSCGKL